MRTVLRPFSDPREKRWRGLLAEICRVGIDEEVDNVALPGTKRLDGRQDALGEPVAGRR